jgi:hypothetical protein
MGGGARVLRFPDRRVVRLRALVIARGARKSRGRGMHLL